MGRASDAERVLQAAAKLAKSQEIADKLAEGLGRLRVGSQQQVP
jgi:hypothetical protein